MGDMADNAIEQGMICEVGESAYCDCPKCKRGDSMGETFKVTAKIAGYTAKPTRSGGTNHQYKLENGWTVSDFKSHPMEVGSVYDVVYEFDATGKYRNILEVGEQGTLQGSTETASSSNPSGGVKNNNDLVAKIISLRQTSMNVISSINQATGKQFKDLESECDAAFKWATFGHTASVVPQTLPLNV